MSDKNLNCEQRIDENVSQCEEHLKVLFHALDEDYDDEDNAEEELFTSSFHIADEADKV